MIYKFKADVVRTINEKIDMNVSADSYEEAEDLVYERLNGLLETSKIVKYLCWFREYEKPESIVLENVLDAA